MFHFYTLWERQKSSGGIEMGKRNGTLDGLTLLWRTFLSYRNQSIDLLCKSMDWFLYDRDFRHERVNVAKKTENNLAC